VPTVNRERVEIRVDHGSLFSGPDPTRPVVQVTRRVHEIVDPTRPADGPDPWSTLVEILSELIYPRATVTKTAFPVIVGY